MVEEGENSIEVFEGKDFRNWLKKNQFKENHVLVILYKKHTGKNKTNAAELMREAICFGWIDTTAKRIDDERWAINYRKRNKKSRWSYNTLRYAEELIKEKKMTASGMEAYREGKKKLPHDYGIATNPSMPKELKIALEKSKKARSNFNKFSSSIKKTYYRWLLKAKLPETKQKRIETIIKKSLENTK